MEQVRKRAVIPARPVRRGFRMPFFVSFLGKQKRKKKIHFFNNPLSKNEHSLSVTSVKAASILSTYVPNSEILFVFCDPPRRTGLVPDASPRI